MAEDFIGKKGQLDERFVGAENKNLQTTKFEKFEVRARREKPHLVEGLIKLKAVMGESDFDKYINHIENINISNKSMLIVAGNEQRRTILIGKWLHHIEQAFAVDNVRIVGGSGVDAY